MNQAMIGVVIACVGAVIVFILQWKLRHSRMKFLDDFFRTASLSKGILDGTGPKTSEHRDDEKGQRYQLQLHESLLKEIAVQQTPSRVPIIMQVVISILVLLSALYVIVVVKDAETSLKDWSYGAIGTIIGFWFKL
jgi:hypothetical protein